MRAEEIRAGMMVRVAKSGKLYKIGNFQGEPAWGYSGAGRDAATGEVGAIQWQINGKYPAGRYYGPWRYLKIANIEAAE